MILTSFVYAALILYLFFRLTCGKAKSPTCLSGKTAIITGGNSGIGYHVALNLASRGCRIILADINDPQATKTKIIEATNNKNITAHHVDLASLNSIRTFVGIIKSTEQRLDILINNAGIGASSNRYTPDGLHPLMQTNSFGPFLLTHLLIDLLKKSAPSRIIFTSSFMAFFHKLELETLNFPMGHSNSLLMNSVIFANANLCNIIMADGFAKRLDGTGITSNSLHPGAANTDIFNQTFSTLKTPRLFVIVWKCIMMVYGKNQANYHDRWFRQALGWNWNNFKFKVKSASEGAQTTLHLATAKELDTVSGCHFWDCVPFPKPSITKNLEFCDRIWQTCEELVSLKPGEVIGTNKD